ncbi:MAG: response regulator [Bdellovibrionota bacterium]|nr:response regulator [Bdellovibrionota bacterium]
MKIMVVDDSKMIQALVKETLESRGISVVLAENGQVAKDKLAAGEEIDLILLDWNMPVMDGPSFLVAVKEESLTSSPIVMMTTENKPEKIQEVIEKGVVEFIMKPFTDDVLFGKIEMVTGVSYAV